MAAVAVLQIAIGTALMLTGVGAVVGGAIISESLNEVFKIMDVTRTR